MKPGGLCSPTDGSSMPSGDTINSLSEHKSPEKSGHHPKATTTEEGHVGQPPLPPEGQPHLVLLAKSHANGMLPHEGLPNGLLSHGKGPAVPRHVRLPLHGESSQEKGSAPCATSPGKEESKLSGTVTCQRLSKPPDAGTSSNLTFSHSLPTMCNKPFQQLSVVTSPPSYSSSKCNAPINAVSSCPGGNTLSPKMISPVSSVSPKGLSLPKSLKSPKGRRKCSLEEMVTKLHNRTESFQSGVSVLPFSPKSVLCDEGKLKNSADSEHRKDPLPEKGSFSDSQTLCQSGVSFPNICDNNNTARICDGHPTLNPTVNVPSTRLHDETGECSGNSSLTVCNIKSKVTTNVSPENIISNEEVYKSQKVPVLHLDECCVDNSLQENPNALEGDHETSCTESSFSKVDGKGNTSSLQCNAEVTRNAQCGVVLNQCSSKPHPISQDKKRNENQASEICRTDCQSGGSVSSSLSDDLKTDQQQLSTDQDSVRSAAGAWQCAGRSESDLIGNDQSLVESDKVQVNKSCTDLTCDVTGNRNTEGKEGCENLVSESCEVISKKNSVSGVTLEHHIDDVIPVEPQSNNEMEAQVIGGGCHSIHPSDEALLKGEQSDNVRSDKEVNIEQSVDETEGGQSVQEVVNELESEKVASGIAQSNKNVTGDNTLGSEQQKDVECVNNQSSLKVINKLIDLTAESESARSSSVELIENEPSENLDSESEIEILYEKKDGTGKDNNTEKSLSRGTEGLNSLQSKPSQVLPAVVNKESEALPYLEPISDDENSLLCAPSTSSGLSSVSGFQSNSDTPMFSDTPSDASRGAIMVRISDAVAAILSDVSDESLPDSPLSFSDKTQGSSEKANDTISSNKSEKIYANVLDNEKLLSAAVDKLCSEETTKDSESLKDRGLKIDAVISESATAVETDNSVCLDSCVKGEQLGPKKSESVEKMEFTVQSLSSVTENNEKVCLESPEPVRNICGLAPSTPSELCNNSEQEQEGMLEPPSLLGEIDIGSSDRSSTSKSTCGITPIGQSSQVSSLPTDKLDPDSSHTQVLLAESCTIACCRMSNNSSHICQNLISGSQKTSSQNQNCNTSQSGGSSDLAGQLIKQPSAIIHNDESANNNRVAGCESGDSVKSRLVCHSEDGSAKSSEKEVEIVTHQSDDTSPKSAYPFDAVLSPKMSKFVDSTVVTSDLTVLSGDNAQPSKEKIFSEIEIPETGNQRESISCSHGDFTTSDVISGSKVTGTLKHTDRDAEPNVKENTDVERDDEPANAEISKNIFPPEEKNIADSYKKVENHLIRQSQVLTTDCKQKFLEESNIPERASRICEQLESRHCHTTLDVNSSRMVDSLSVLSNTLSQVSEERCEPSSKPVDVYLLAESSASTKTCTQDSLDLDREVRLVPPPSEIINNIAHPLPVDIKESLPQSVAPTDASHPETNKTSATNEAEQGVPTPRQEAIQSADASSKMPDRMVAACTLSEPLDGSFSLANITEAICQEHAENYDFKHIPSEDAKARQAAADLTEISLASLEKPESKEVAAELSVMSGLSKVNKAVDEATKHATIKEVTVFTKATVEATETSQVFANVLDASQGAATLFKDSQGAAYSMETNKSESDKRKTVKQTHRKADQTTVDIFEEIQSLAKAVQEDNDVSETPCQLVEVKETSTSVGHLDVCPSLKDVNTSCSSSVSKDEEVPVITEYHLSLKEAEACHPPPETNIAEICSVAEGGTETTHLGDRGKACFSNNDDVESSNLPVIEKGENPPEACVILQDIQSDKVSYQTLGGTKKGELQTMNSSHDSAGNVSKIDSSEGDHPSLLNADSISYSLKSVHVTDDKQCEASWSTESHPAVGAEEGNGTTSELTVKASPAKLRDSHPSEEVIGIRVADAVDRKIPHSLVAVVDQGASKDTQVDHPINNSQVDDSAINKLPPKGSQVHHPVDNPPVDEAVVDHRQPKEIDDAEVDNPPVDEAVVDQPQTDIVGEVVTDHRPVKAVTDHPPVDDTLADHSQADLADDVVADRSSVDEVVADRSSVDEVVADLSSVNEAEVDHLPVDETLADHPQADIAIEPVTDHPPVAEAVADHPPVAEAVADHPPVAEAVADHPPVAEAVADHPPVAEAVADHPPVAEAVANHPPVAEAVTDHPPVAEAVSDHPPVAEAVSDHPPVAEAVAEHPPVAEAVSDHPPVAEAVAEHPPVAEAVSDHPPVAEAIADHPQADIAIEPVTDHPPVAEAVADHPPVAEAVSDLPPVAEAVAEHPPVAEAVSDHPPVAEAIADHPQADIAIEPVTDHPPVAEAVADHPLVAEAVADHPLVAETVSDHPPVAEAVADHPPVAEAVADHPPVAEAVADHPPVAEAVSDHPPVAEAVSDHPPVAEAVSDHPPVAEAVSDHPSLAEAVSDHPPVAEAVSDHPPVAETVDDHPPVAEAVTDHPPVAEAVSDHPPVAEAVSDHPPVAETVDDHPPVAEAVTDHPPVAEAVSDHPPVAEAVADYVQIDEVVDHPQADIADEAVVAHPQTDDSQVGHPLVDAVVDQPQTEESQIGHLSSRESVVDLPATNDDDEAQSQSVLHHPPAEDSVVDHPPAEDSAFDHPPAEDSVVDHLPAEDSAFDHPPAEDSVVDHPPAEDSVVDHPPAEDSVVDHPPAEDSVVDHPPAEDSVVDHPPAKDSVVDHPPAEDSVVDHPPAEDSAFDHPPAEDSVVDHPPAEDSVVDHPPAEDSAFDHPPAEDSLVDHPPAEDSVVDHPPAEDSVVDHPPAEDSVVDHPPAEDSVVDHPPAEDSVVDHPPAEDSAFDHPPAEDSVVDHPPAEDSVVDHPPAEDSVVDHPPAEDSVVDHPPAEDSVVDHPLAEDSVVDHPPAEDSVVDHPPAKDSVVDHPPAEDSAFDHPPAEDSAIDHPPAEDSVVDHPPAEDSVVDHPPAEDSVVDHPPAEDSTIDHPPAEDSVVDHPPAEDSVVDHPPAKDSAFDHPPAEDSAFDHPPAEDSVVDHPPAEDSAFDHPPAEDSAIDHPPAEDSVVDHPPAEDSAFDHPPAEDSVVDHPPAEDSVVDHPPAEDFVVDHPPAEDSVVDHPPAEDSVVNHPPAEDSVVDHPPAEDSAIDHPPAEDSAIDHPPAEDSAIDHPPAEDSTVDHPPAEDSTVDHPPAEDSTVDHPPAEDSTVDHPPAEDSAIDHPPAEDSTVDHPPAEDSTVDHPPAEDSTVDHPPAEDSTVDHPPAEDSTVDHPPAEDSTIDHPPAESSGIYHPAAEDPTPSNLAEEVCEEQAVDAEDGHTCVVKNEANQRIREDNPCTVTDGDNYRSTSDTGNDHEGVVVGSTNSAVDENEKGLLLDNTLNLTDVTDRIDTAVEVPVCDHGSKDSADSHTTDDILECIHSSPKVSVGISDTAEVADHIHRVSVASDGCQGTAEVLEGILQNTEAIDESIRIDDMAEKRTKADATENTHATSDSMECGTSKTEFLHVPVEERDASFLHDCLKLKAVELGPEAAKIPTEGDMTESSVQDECNANKPPTSESNIKDTISPQSEFNIKETHPKASIEEERSDISPGLPPKEGKASSDNDPNAFEHKFEVVSGSKSLTSPIFNEVLALEGSNEVSEEIIENCSTKNDQTNEITQSGVECLVQFSDETGDQHGNSSEIEVAQNSTGLHQPASMSQQSIAEVGKDISSGAELLEENTLIDNDTVEMDKKPELVTLCPLCMKTFNQPLDLHLAEFHICNHFIPAKRTQAYKLHMLQRVQDISHVTEAIDTQEFVYVCRSCQFASKDINAVRFHVNIHEDVYQAIPGKISCECNQKKYSYPFHKWKHLLHCSTYECMICKFYFACEKGLLNHLHALHFSEGTCKSCKMEVTQDGMLTHACLTSCKNDSETLDLEPEESNVDFRFGLSWNTLDNYINYLDGKDFRLNTSSKVVDLNLDRSYLKFPIKNVLSEALVPDEVKLDPGKDISKYMKGKKNVKQTLSEESYEIVKNFHLSVQFDLEKKLGRKGRRGQGIIPRAKREDDLFDVLGLGTIRSRGSSRHELGEPSHGHRTKKGRSKAKQEANKEESDLHGQDLPNLTRTRSGMQPMREESEKIYETPGPLSESGIVIDGEWTKNHTYICCSCGAGYLDLADMMDHKWESHPSVWCAHTMIQGQGDVPASFCKQYQPPTSQPPKLPLPGTTLKHTPSSTPSRRNSDANTPTPAEKPQHVCSLCKLEFQERTQFHAHLVECGGLNYMATSKKKNKKGFRFKRRKGQGVPSNRYGNSSQPGTPLKAKPGDRSSGLNTPQLDRTSQGAVQSSGVKRRLELAVGSIDNAELKNRLKAIITGSRKATGNAAGMSSRRTIRMKLRKKALETKRLRKTRHSDRVKENVLKPQEKGKEEGGKEKEKKIKDESLKIQGKKGKEETVREEEKEEENPAKGKKVKSKNPEGNGESSTKDKEKKDKFASIKGLKDEYGDSESDSAKKITRRRGSAEQPKQSKQTKSVIDKVNQKVLKKKQAKGESSELVTNIKELSTKSTSETVDVLINAKVTKKKSKYLDVSKDVLLDEKKLQALKKVNGVVGLSDRELQPVCKIKELKGKTKAPGGKVGRKAQNQISSVQVGAEQNSQKKINDKKEQSAKKNIENMRKSGINKVAMLTGKKVKGSRAMLDTTIVKASKKISKKKQEAMEAGVPLEKEVVSLPAPVEEKGVMMQKKNVKGKKYLTEKKSATTKKKSAPHDKLNTDEESREGLEQNLKYNPEKAPEAIELDGTKFDKDAIKKNVYLISSSEETADESDDSEPEVSRNFRTGRRCGGRMGLRNKRKPQNQRYSFRSCLDPEETENDKDEREIVKDSMVIKTNIEETKDELPLTPKRKRKIANYEDDDDFTYMPSGNSTDLEEESSDGVEVLGKEVSTSLRKRRKTTLPSSDSDGHMPARRASLQRRGSALTSEGETPDDSYDENATKTSKASLALDVSNNSKVLIERKIPKKKNMRLQCLVSQVMKSEDKFERLGQKGPKKNRESKSSIIISEDEKKTSGKIRVRKLANTTDESQESESTVDEDYIGKTSLIPVSSKRKKTAKKPVPSLIPLGEASMADNICRYDDDDDDDDEDNIPLATIAQLKGRSLPRRIAMSNIIKEKVKSVAVRSKKLASGVQKHLPRQVMDTGTADSESSGFEGFVPVSVKKNKRRIGLKHKSKIMAPMAASENEVDTSSNTEISSSPKPKRKCTAAKKIENNATEILVSKSTKDKTKIFYTKAGDEEKTNAFSMQSTKADQSSTNLETKAQQSSTNVKSDTKKTRKYVRKSTEAVAAMPVLEPVNWQEAGSETPSTDTGDILSSSEGDASQKQPAKVRRRRSSVEKIKDIPTRSSAILLHENMTPPDLKAVSTSDTVHETSLLENIQPVWENKVPVPSKPRKRRTKSSHELLPQTESAVNAPQENTVVSNVDGGKAPKKTKRKRASSMSNMSGAEAEKVVRMKSPLRVNTGEASKNVSAKSPKKNSEGQKRKKNAHKDDMHDLKCVDCGLRFGSVASLEDHQQDCVTIAFEMSLMEAEDHLFECPHCHLTFALKGTQRKHTTSCRLAKSRKTPHRGEMKAMKRMNRTTAPPQEPLLPDATDSSIVANPCQGAPIKSRRRSKENVASDEGVNAASPLKDSFKQNFVNISEVADKSDSEKQLEKTKKLAPVPYSRSNSKVRKELQTNGQLENFEGVDLFCLTKIDGVQKCSVCGYEVVDKESVDKHRLLQQFTHHCQQKTVLEVCALLTNYNLSIDTVRTLITSASILHGSTVLNLDAKQQSYLEGNSVTTVSASNCALQLKELLTSPHCTRILSVLDTIATHHRTSRTVSISGTRQEALKAVSALEELLKEISEIDNSIKKNRMLKSMRETFEAGTIN